VAPASDQRTKFATYFRDLPGLDYARQRYYSNVTGRFLTPDPGGFRTANLKNPIHWNRYVYASDDPINRVDPSGRDDCPVAELGARAYDLPGCYQNDFEYQWNQQMEQQYDAWLANAIASFGIDPDCVQLAISAAASGTGLNLSGLTDPWVQIVGTSNGNGTYGETELNFSGSAATIQGLITQMCNLKYANNNQCPGGAGNNPLVGAPHSGFSGNFRSPGLNNSVQVNTFIDTTNPDPNAVTSSIQVDVDPYNPSAGYGLGLILHGVLQVIPNKITGGDNTYGCTH
jgi:RHS repeat-associated protein